MPSDPGPSTAEGIAAALDPFDGRFAVDLMTRLATEDLVFPTMRHGHAQSRQAAQKVVCELGPEAEWFTNTGNPPYGTGWTPVTSYTFDSAIVGTASGIIVVLLQVGED
ncbi:hypothetical protein [Pseudonocardia spinosispora]|uniref:hypothetical protein n=1 Tax=Pseudonocardia spinosispora TaxID=103441 RepID=UPI0012EB7FE3|nr:hypothetical protein [Pseudonocardia spinosispora]